MDSFQGSIPPNFISFRLENQTSEDGTHSNPAVMFHTESEDTIPRDSQSITELFNSPRSADSERDVNAYVEAKVQSMELEPSSSKEASPNVLEEEMELSGSGGNDQSQQLTIVSCRTSSPIVPDRNETTNTSLTALESALRVAMSSGTQLPELLPIAQQDPRNMTVTTAPTDEDKESCVYEVPALPSTDLKARFLTDLSEGEKTAEEVSNPGCPPLYANNPFASESVTEAGDETDSGTSRLPQQTAPSSKQKEDQLPERSGRSRRALLKTYFEEVNAFELTN